MYLLFAILNSLAIPKSRFIFANEAEKSPMVQSSLQRNISSALVTQHVIKACESGNNQTTMFSIKTSRGRQVLGEGIYRCPFQLGGEVQVDSAPI